MFDEPGGSWTATQGLIDGLLAVEEVSAAFLRVPPFAASKVKLISE